tara:strand:+ start:199 stop:1074 length:876 start_codon:yes stop_codon:yes gene_type:complete
MADATVVFAGWNSSTQSWGAGTWGNDVAFPVTATASVGAVTITGASSVPSVVGVAATGAVGSVSVTAGTGVNVTPTGIAATGGVGSATVEADSSVSIPVSPLTEFAVTVVNAGSGNKYNIGGSAQPTLTLVEGNTYKFDQSDSSNSGHPLRLSITSDGTHGGGSAYTTGVTTNGSPGSSGAYTQIVVAAGAPTLYYYCTNHSGMGGQANTDAGLVSFGGTGQITATTSQVIPVAPTGISSTAVVNSATIVCECDANVSVTGVSATGLVSRVTVWGRIIPDTSPDIWTEIAA